jgi:hypothetical protein
MTCHTLDSHKGAHRYVLKGGVLGGETCWTLADISDMNIHLIWIQLISQEPGVGFYRDWNKQNSQAAPFRGLFIAGSVPPLSSVFGRLNVFVRPRSYVNV